MELTHIEHLGIAVKSIEACLPYYEEVLGLKCYNIEEVADQKVKTAFFKVGQTKIELLEPTSEDSTIAKFIEKKGEGIHHIAFAVPDVQAALNDAEAKGVKLIDKAPRGGAEGLSIAFFLLQRGENLDVALGFFIADVEPELIELIGGGVATVEPNVSLFRLSEFLSVGFGDERAGQCVGIGVCAEFSADEFRSRGDVTPLVGTAHLQFAVFGFVEVEEVVALEQLVGELCEGESVACFSVEAFFDAVLRHHVVHGDVFSDFACEVEEGEVLHPVVVVHEFRSVRRVGVKVQEVCELFFDTCHVVAECFLVEEVSLGAFSGGVSDHTRGAADEGEGFVTGLLEVAEHHHAAEVSDVQGVGGRVNADVGSCHPFGKHFVCSGHHLMQHAAPFQFFYKIHSLMVSCYLCREIP